MNNTIDVDLGGQIISVKQFNVNTMCEHPVITIIGEQQSGKSWLCRYLLNKVIGPNIDAGAIFCPTEKFTSFYSKCFPDLFIHEKFTNGDLSKILHRQDVISERTHAGVKSFVLLDNCLEKDYFYKQSMTEPLLNARHYKLSFILTMSFPLGVPVEARCNFDYVFLFRENIYSNIKRIYDHYGGMFPSFESFRRVFRTLTETEDFVAMVIVNRGFFREITDKIFWINATDVENDNLVGSQDFWDFHNRHYRGENYIEGEEGIEDNDEEMFGAFANLNKMRGVKPTDAESDYKHELLNEIMNFDSEDEQSVHSDDDDTNTNTNSVRSDDSYSDTDTVSL